MSFYMPNSFFVPAYWNYWNFQYPLMFWNNQSSFPDNQLYLSHINMPSNENMFMTQIQEHPRQPQFQEIYNHQGLNTLNEHQNSAQAVGYQGIQIDRANSEEIQQNRLRIIKNGKNINSNLLKYFVLYLQNQFIGSGKLQKMAKSRIITTNQLKLKEDIQKYIKPKKHYFRLSVIRDIIDGKNCSQEFAKLVRIALRIFLMHDLPSFLRKSPRIQCKSQLAYIHEGRRLFRRLAQKEGK